MTEANWFELKKSSIKGLFAYYILLGIIGIGLTILVLYREAYNASIPISVNSIIGGFGMALIGCTIFYSRKLYKSLISGLAKESDELSDLKELGVMFYFLLRPLFSIIFSLFIHVSVKSSVNFVTINEANLDVGFIYLIMVLSFLGGFASGDFLDYLEKTKHSVLNKLK